MNRKFLTIIILMTTPASAFDMVPPVPPIEAPTVATPETYRYRGYDAWTGESTVLRNRGNGRLTGHDGTSLRYRGSGRYTSGDGTTCRDHGNGRLVCY